MLSLRMVMSSIPCLQMLLHPNHKLLSYSLTNFMHDQFFWLMHVNS
jgi:hypothetical protein